MRWARVAVGIGLLLLVLGFGFGTDTPISTRVAGHSYDCGDVIPTGWLVSGLAAGSGADTRTPAERRLDERILDRCAPLQRNAQWAIWGGLGVGALLLLTGWTALREREHDEEVARRTPVPAGV